MIAVLLADGFEEIEALTPVDMLRRANFDVRTVAIGSKIAIGAHKIPVICDMEAHEVNVDELTMLILPGGMPGSLNLDASPDTDRFISAVLKNGGRLAAICAAPLVLGRRGLLDGKQATCYPGFENELRGAEIMDKAVVTDGNITTAKGMEYSLPFAKELVRLLTEKPQESEAKDASGADNSNTDTLSQYLTDKLFVSAVEISMQGGKISTSLLQRKLFIGYAKAAMLIDMMEELGFVSEPDGQRPRDVLITKEEWKDLLKRIGGSSDGT